ncbi:MAG TPA: DUF6569 family protein [Blastocatellia bacterium]|nr:DUF6569 family protein [Blastocatellia bacterium]
MRTPIRIVLGILVTGVVMASTLFALAQTKSPPLTPYPTINVIPSRAAGGPVNRDWRLGAPVTFQALTVYPVIADQPDSRDDYITLDEGLRSGRVIVSEIGANGRTRRVGNGRRVSDNAEVNRLMVTNNSGKTLVLIAGELIVGGKQDRIVGEDCVIASSKKPVTVNVYCVEHGRWSERSSFGQSRASSGSGGGEGSAAAPAGTFNAPVAGGMAAPNVRAKAQAEKSQEGVWSEVSKLEQKNGVSSSTGTLDRVYSDRRVSAKLSDYERAIKNKVSGKNVVGAVVAIGGQVMSADVFVSPKLFQAYWPKLLKSYALEAVSSGKDGSQTVDRVIAEAFLARVDAPASSGAKKDGYKLTEYQSDRDASFELESDDKGAGKLIHFNRVNKK